jgi:hypothetical protein
MTSHVLGLSAISRHLVFVISHYQQLVARVVRVRLDCHHVVVISHGCMVVVMGGLGFLGHNLLVVVALWTQIP